MSANETMPVEILTQSVVRDPSEHVEGFCGRAGGSYDDSSGVLTLAYVPYSQAEMGVNETDPLPEWAEDIHAQTTAQFVEVERLLDVLSGIRPEHDREWWREVLTEKLDAHGL